MASRSLLKMAKKEKTKSELRGHQNLKTSSELSCAGYRGQYLSPCLCLSLSLVSVYQTIMGSMHTQHTHLLTGRKLM